MRVIEWRIINPKTRMFWSNLIGWVGEADATAFTATEKQTFNLPIAGAWVPNIVGGLKTTDDLREALALFPPGTPIAGSHGKLEGFWNAKIFLGLIEPDTMEERLSGAPEDDGEKAKVFAVIHLA